MSLSSTMFESMVSLKPCLYKLTDSATAFCFFFVVNSSPNYHTRILICLIFCHFLSLTILSVRHKSYQILILRHQSVTCQRFLFQSWPTNNSNPGLSVCGFYLDLGQLCNFHLIRILVEHFSKFFLAFGSFVDLWTDRKPNPISRTWMSFSEKVLWVLLSTVLEQKTPARRPPLVKIIWLEIT